MKTPARMSAGFMILCLAAGALAGAFIPLPSRGGKASATTQAGVPRPADPAPKPAPGPVNLFLGGVTVADATAAATTAPNEFFQWLLKSDPQPSPEVVEAFFIAWIERNPDAAFQAALRLPSRFGYTMESQFFPRQVQLLFRRDPMTALRWVGRIEGSIGHDITLHMTTDLTKTLAPLDPEEVRAWLNRSPVGGVSAGMAKAFAETLSETDPAAAIRWAGTLNVEYQNLVLPMALYRLAQQDPAAAMEYIRNAPSHVRQYGTLFAMSPESAADVMAQMKWLEDEMGVSSYTGLSNLMARLHGIDPQAARDHVMSMEGTTQGIDAVRGLAEAVCYSGSTEKAVAFIATLPDSLQQDAAHAAMMTRMPGDFPAFLNPLADGSITGANLDGYIRLLTRFASGERAISSGRLDHTWNVGEVPEHLEGFQNWLRDHPGPGRDRFIRETHAAMGKEPALRDKIFGSLPPEELTRILEDR